MVRVLRGGDADDFIRRAKTDSDVELLMDEFDSRGWELVDDDIDVIRSEEAARPFTFVILPYRTFSEPEQAFIVWTGSTHFETGGFHYKRIEAEGETRNWEITSFYEKQSDISTVRSIVPSFGGCDDVNWKCVMRIAGSYAPSIAACASCVQTMSPFACLTCIGTVLEKIGSDQQPCDWCND